MLCRNYYYCLLQSMFCPLLFLTVLLFCFYVFIWRSIYSVRYLFLPWSVIVWFLLHWIGNKAYNLIWLRWHKHTNGILDFRKSLRNILLIKYIKLLFIAFRYWRNQLITLAQIYTISVLTHYRSLGLIIVSPSSKHNIKHWAFPFGRH